MSREIGIFVTIKNEIIVCLNKKALHQIKLHVISTRPSFGSAIWSNTAGDISTSPDLHTGQRSCTTASTDFPFRKMRIDFPHNELLFGLPFGVDGSKSGAANATIIELSLSVKPHAPKPGLKNVPWPECVPTSELLAVFDPPTGLGLVCVFDPPAGLGLVCVFDPLAGLGLFCVFDPLEDEEG